MPGKIEAAHHTLADWDFEHGAEGRSLDASFYISEPTSLKMAMPVGMLAGSVLCRIPGTLVLPQGEVRTWLRANYYNYCPCVFRNQAPLGTSNSLNCYRLATWDAKATLYRIVDGASVYSTTTDCYTPYDEWVHYLVFWYNGKTPGETPALCVDIYVEVAEEWVKQGDTLYDTANAWKDSEINRCGIWPTPFSGYHNWFDDTEIWGPV